MLSQAMASVQSHRALQSLMLWNHSSELLMIVSSTCEWSPVGQQNTRSTTREGFCPLPAPSLPGASSHLLAPWFLCPGRHPSSWSPYFFFGLQWVFVAEHSLFIAVTAFSSCGGQGLLSSCHARASHCSGFSCCRVGALRYAGFCSCCSQALERRLSGCGTQV